MSRFTPGPWKISSDGLGVCAYLPGKSKEDIKTKQSYYVPLAEVSYHKWQEKSDWPISKEEYRANAQAIACVPELVEALEYAISFLEHGIRPHVTASLTDKLKQVLNKIEGKE